MSLRVLVPSHVLDKQPLQQQVQCTCDLTLHSHEWRTLLGPLQH